jgi:Mn-dependent DtxR family transcriptional regulator
MLTNRDKQYLRAVFLLQRSTDPVGPKKLAEKMGVSKVCAFQKMRRLEAMGYGEYIHRKGLKLNKLGVTTVEQEIKKHHVLERFLEDTFKIPFQEACDHSNHISPLICDKLMNNIENKVGTNMNCNCGNCLETPKNHSDLRHCHWLKKII